MAFVYESSRGRSQVAISYGVVNCGSIDKNYVESAPERMRSVTRESVMKYRIISWVSDSHMPISAYEAVIVRDVVRCNQQAERSSYICC